MSNLPNILSVFRLALTPFFPILYFSFPEEGNIYAGIVFIIAGLSDILDGFIARRFNSVSALGRVLDPLADKLMQLSAMTTLAIDRKLPIWFFALFTIKEMVMLIGGLRLYRAGADVIPSNFLGKATAVLFYIVMLALMFFDVPPHLTDILLVGLLSLAVVAAGIYYTSYKTKIRN